MIIRSNFIFMILSLPLFFFFFFFNDTATTEIYTLSLHDALPISLVIAVLDQCNGRIGWALDVVPLAQDRKSTRLNSSHGYISYAVFCLKKKKKSHQRLFHINLLIHPGHLQYSYRYTTSLLHGT